MKKRRKRIIIALAVIAALVFIMYLNKDPVIRHCYRHRFFAGAFSNVDITSGYQTKTLNFDFSLRDMDFFNSFGETSIDSGNRQTVDLNMEGKNFPVELLPFKNYFKRIKLNCEKTSFSIRFPPGNMIKNKVRRVDLFQIKGIDFFEQELIYDLGRRLNLYIPKTQFVNVYINFADYGDYSFKQAYDGVFLEQNGIPESIVFMIGPSGKGKWTLHYLYNQSGKRGQETHLNRFLELLETRDNNLLVKYFDLDYMARFEALRKLLEAKSGFVTGSNLRYVYNKTTGKIYPLLDESNIFNMHKKADKMDRRLRLLRKQINDHPEIKRKRRYYLSGLGKTGSYKAITGYFKKSEKKYSALTNNWLYQLRVRLVAMYFSGHIYSRLKKFGRDRIPESAPRDSPLYSQVTRSKSYLDRMVLAPRVFLNMNKHLDLSFRGRKIILAPGDYTLYKPLVIPLGYIFEIAGDTTIKLAPKVSVISYSPVHIRGTAGKPVKIEALEPGKPFGVFTVMGKGRGREDEETCRISHLDFSGGSRGFIDGVKLTAGLNFYNIGTVIKNSRIHHNSGGSGLTVKNAWVKLENNALYSNFSDQLTLDFCKGIVKNNRFFNGGEDPNGDGIALKDSEIFLKHNFFENLNDKGVSTGSHSAAVFYDNRFKSSRMGVASKDRSQVLLLANRFTGNETAVTAYQKKKELGGGSVYLFENTFKYNKKLYDIDKFSKRFHMQERKGEQKNIYGLIVKQKTDLLFAAFRGLRSRYRYKENRMEGFYIGDTQGSIDETDRLIFVDLPQGSSVIRPVHYKCSLEKTETYLIPTAYGIHRQGSGIGEEKRIVNRQKYNFREYIFRGTVSLRHDYQVDDYELVVTTGTLPIVEIDTADKNGIPREIKNEPKIPCKIRFIYPSDAPAGGRKYLNRFLEAGIEGRGKKWEKWKYGITLEKRIAFGGMKKSKRWVLESSYVEKSLMRSKIAFDLLDQFRETETPSRKRIAPESRFIEVILNGDYYGVYLLIEHVDRNFLELEDFDKNDSYNALLYRAKNENANFSPYNTSHVYRKEYKDFPGGVQPREKDEDPIRGWTSGFEQRYPDKEKYGEYWKPIANFSKYVALSSDQEFERRIFDVLDIERYINLWILIQLADDSDGLYQNRYIARRKGKNARWYFIPWDKDGVLGRDYDMNKRPHTLWLHTPLFDRCMAVDWFGEAFASTWNTLVKKGIISEKNIFDMIDRNAGILEDAQKRNFRRWPAGSHLYPDTNSFEQEIAYMKDWIGKRIQWLEQKIKNNSEKKED